MHKYSGLTTSNTAFCVAGKPNLEIPGPTAFQQVMVFDVQWTDCPIEVCDEVKRLWQDFDLVNDTCVYKWSSEADGDDYPTINEYLTSNRVFDCWIHYWW